MAEQTVDAVIVGAGFSGLYMLHRLRGLGLTARVYEAGEGVGGTWYWNRYPGARVDIESQEYSYSFSPELEDEWTWTERYAAQPELLRYLNHVADRFDLRRDIRFSTRVVSAVFDEGAARWTVTTDTGETASARFCIMATGCLSAPNEPRFPGQEDFKGPIYLTSRWPHEGVDFTGQRVGVIGTGSSAIQSIPVIAGQAAQVTVFQRTPNYSVPAHNGPIDPKVAADWKAQRAQRRAEQRVSNAGFIAHDPNDQSALAVSEAERQAIFEERWRRGGFSLGGAFNDLSIDPKANSTAAAFVAGKIREIVKDPRTAEALTPKTYPFGTKRLCVDTGYYDTFNRDNVSLVDLRETPIEAITPTGLRTTGGAYEFDALVFAIGFDAMTGALARIDIRGRGGARPAGGLGRGGQNLSGPDGGGLSQSLHHHRSGQPVGALQHGGLHRAACGLDHRLHRLSWRPAARRDRGDRRGAGRLGGPCQRSGRPDPLSPGQLLVPRGQRPGKTQGVHALCRRRRPLPRALRGGGGQQLRRLRPAIGGGLRPFRRPRPTPNDAPAECGTQARRF